MPTKIHNLKVNMNWFQTSEFEITKTFIGAAQIGSSPTSSINVQVNLPALNALDGTFMVAQPVGTSTPGVEAFSTRVVRITPSPTEGSAIIHITRVDKASSWDMPLQLHLQLTSIVTS